MKIADCMPSPCFWCSFIDLVTPTSSVASLLAWALCRRRSVPWIVLHGFLSSFATLRLMFLLHSCNGHFFKLGCSQNFRANSAPSSSNPAVYGAVSSSASRQDERWAEKMKRRLQSVLFHAVFCLSHWPEQLSLFHWSLYYLFCFK